MTVTKNIEDFSFLEISTIKYLVYVIVLQTGLPAALNTNFA